MNYFSIKEKSKEIKELIKDFAINEITNNLSFKDFVNNVNFIETKIIDFLECSSNPLTTYSIYSEEDSLDITIQIYKTERLWSIEYQDLNENIDFSVEKFNE